MGLHAAVMGRDRGSMRAMFAMSTPHKHATNIDKGSAWLPTIVAEMFV
jgi:hypothetical protein